MNLESIKKRRVLLVEDDELSQLVIKTRLTSHPLEVIATAELEEAKQKILSETYDIIVLDYFIQNGTALDLLPFCKDKPVIILTSSQDIKLAIDIMKKGARDFIIKDSELLFLEILPDTIFKLISVTQSELLIKEANLKINDLLNRLQSSINYSKRIQTAIFPSEKKIKELFPNTFLIFKPRDVVSGDFYWFNKSRDLYFFACADCTGHGVPGALLSMLGTELLNRIILLGVSTPDFILHELNNQFMRLLTTDEDGIDDGMDIALCVYDKKNKILNFAGAHNSLYYTQGNEVVEIKGDRQSIGGSKEATEYYFKNHSIPVAEPITIYLHTDGITDQFGGPDNKKFTKPKLKKLLTDIQHLDIDTQREKIEEELTIWRGGYRQLDDILVIGNRITP